MGFRISPGDATFGAAAAFLAGILSVSTGWNIAAPFFTFLICGALFCVRKRTFFLPEAILFSVMLFAGGIYYRIYVNAQAQRPVLSVGSNISFTGVVSDELRPSGDTLILPVTPTDPASVDVLVFAPRETSFHYGDLLHIKGEAVPPREAGGEIAVFAKKIDLVARHKASWLKENLFAFKDGILQRFNTVLPKDEAALLGGITFGSKQDFDKTFKTDMALSGTTHLVAISGYNITIIIVMVGRVFGEFLARRTVFVLSCCLIVLFVVMTGGQASAVRAAVMGFLALTAGASGRSGNIRNAIAVTAAVMAIFDPTILTANAGFELSFLSLLGLVYLDPPIKKLLRMKDEGFLEWKANAVTTFAAQLGVLPVAIHTFGTFSAFAIVANVLVLGTVPLTMLLGFLLACLGPISSTLTFFTAALARLLLSYQIFVIRFFGTHPLPLPITFASGSVMLAYYAGLGIFAFLYT